MKNSLPKKEILRSKKKITQTLNNGKNFSIGGVECVVEKTNTNENGKSKIEVLFGAPKKIAPRSIDRNKIKRQLREAYRKNKEDLFLYATENKIDLKILMFATKNDIKKNIFIDAVNTLKRIKSQN